MRERDIVRRLIHRHQTRDPFELAFLTDREIVIQPSCMCTRVLSVFYAQPHYLFGRGIR